MSKTWKIVATVLLLGVITACVHEPILNPVSGPGVVITDTTPIPIDPGDTTVVVPIDTTPVFVGKVCSPDTVYFQNDILPLITSNCTQSGCHGNTNPADGIKLTNYTQIRSRVSPGNPGSSKLYKVMATTDNGDRMPPPPYTAMTAAQLALMSKWIQQGAKDNYCDANAGVCDTVNVSYANKIAPMMTKYCTGCHSGPSPSAGISLTTYANVKAYGQNGRLYGSVAHLVGYVAMPPSGVMQACEVKQIHAWVAAGALNN